MDPLVSVVIPTHNGARTIRQAIDSALEQKNVPGDFELIVVDDASSDDTAKILQSYGRKLTSVVRSKNCGVSATVNHGALISRGKFVAFLHDDDYFQPGKLREAVLALNQNPEAALAFSDYIVIDSETDEPIEVVKFEHSPELREMFAKWEFVGPACNVTVRKSLFDACGGFDERLRWAEDINLWLRLRYYGPFVHIPAVLAAYRKRRSVSVQEERYSIEQKAEFERVMREHFGELAENLIEHARDQRAAMLLALLCQQQMDHMHGDALRTLYELIRFRPSYLLRSVPIRRLMRWRHIRRQ
jgi:glycosyltransferase involved in cell wall biosynthesis